MTEPLIVQRGPYKVALTSGKKYAWCACGRSAAQPFCDGSHKGTGLTPVVFTADKTADVYLCGCKHTAGKPYCDGTHNRLS